MIYFDLGMLKMHNTYVRLEQYMHVASRVGIYRWNICIFSQLDLDMNTFDEDMETDFEGSSAI